MLKDKTLASSSKPTPQRTACEKKKLWQREESDEFQQQNEVSPVVVVSRVLKYLCSTNCP